MEIQGTAIELSGEVILGIEEYSLNSCNSEQSMGGGMEGNLGTCSPTRTGSAKTAVSASRGHNPITGVITSGVFNPTVLGENDWLPFIRLN